MASLVNGFDDLLEAFEDSSELTWVELNNMDGELVELTDWKIKLGKKIYAVHTSSIGDGVRQSKFFNAQFKHWSGPTNAKVTDLTTVLPSSCSKYFEETLNYFYSGVPDQLLRGENVVAFFKIAHVLQIKNLATECVKWMKENLSHETAILMLQQAVQLSPGLDAIEENCIQACALEFNSCNAKEFLRLPTEALSKILEAATTKYSADDAKICHAVTTYVRGISDGNRTVVFLELAKRILVVPKKAAIDALYLLGKSIEHNDNRLKNLCVPIVAANFKNVNHDDLVAIPDHKIVCDLLDDDELNVRSEDQVFDAIYNYCQTKDGLTTRMKEEIWETCRFSYLSSRCAVKMLTLDIAEIPSRCVQLALASCIAGVDKLSQSLNKGPLEVKRLQPRRVKDENGFFITQKCWGKYKGNKYYK